MIAPREQILPLIIISLGVVGGCLAESKDAHSRLSVLESVSWTDGIKDPSEKGAMVSYYSQNPTAVPFFYPKLVSVFEFMDYSNNQFYTLKQLTKNPSLAPRPKYYITKNTETFHTKKIVVQEPENVSSLEQRIRDLEQKLFDAQYRPAYQPNDEELNAFVRRGQSKVTAEQRLEYLTKVISEKNNTPTMNQVENPSFTAPKKQPHIPIPQNEVDMVSIPLPPSMDEMDADYPQSIRFNQNKKSVLRFKATVPTPQGRGRPAQASDFYLTTQNLQELLGELKIDRAVAGEVRSFAEIWANAEKDSTSNPEIALGVKSILLEAKVGKTRTDPFGQAELNGVSPDDRYYLIGIDKDDSSGVVTIWSKNIEVAPGDNRVELTSNDVIYQE